MNWDNTNNNGKEENSNDYGLTHVDTFCHMSAFLNDLSMGTTGNLEFRLLKAVATNQHKDNTAVTNKVTHLPGNVTVPLVLFAVLDMNASNLLVVQFLGTLPR
jgi:hypothetical protein